MARIVQDFPRLAKVARLVRPSPEVALAICFAVAASAAVWMSKAPGGSA